jgi:hypothetical protein
LPGQTVRAYDPAMMWMFFVLVLLIPLIAVVLDSQVGRAVARRIEEGGSSGDRLARLEGEIERLSRELELLREQTEFVDRLLRERRQEQLPEGEARD